MNSFGSIIIIPLFSNQVFHYNKLFMVDLFKSLRDFNDHFFLTEFK